MVLVSVAVAYWVASGGRPEATVMTGVLIGTLLVASSASALNQWLEWRYDAMMERTANRPLPAARLTGRESLVFAAACLVIGAAHLYLAAGNESLAWAVATWVLYVCVYTPSKRRTPLNTALGAVAGAMPILIGWTAAPTPFDLRVASLCGVLFLWQFPHFMAIAWMYRRQYSRAGMKMLPVVDPTGRRAGRQAVLAAAALVPVRMLPALAMPATCGILYAVGALSVSALLLACAIVFRIRLSDLAARRLLRASLIFLPAILLFIALARWQ